MRQTTTSPREVIQIPSPEPKAEVDAQEIIDINQLRPPKPTGYAFDEGMLLHQDPQEDHPEQPLRLISILERFREGGLLERCTQVPAREFPAESARACHTEPHVDFVERIARTRDGSLHFFLLHFRLETDTETLISVANQLDSLYLCRGSGLAAKTAVSCTTSIACDIANRKIKNGFAIVRPPGHHAEPSRAMGFCLYNNVAIASKELARLGLASRILIVDWDVHYGNGTAKIVQDDPNILFISLHRYDKGKFYPGAVEASPSYTGSMSAPGKAVNVGWNGGGATDADYMAAFSRIVVPIVNEFVPDFVFVSAGFDAASGDPIGDCLLTPRGYALMTHALMGLADGKLLLVLEGGYNLPVIASCAEACMRTLLGEPVPMAEKALGPVRSSALVSIEETVKAQSAFWKSLHPHYYKPVGGAAAHPTLQNVLEVYWAHVCVKSFDLIPLPLADPLLANVFHDRVYISDNVLDRTKGVIVFAHEGGTAYSHSCNTNLIDLKRSLFVQPFQEYIETARDEGYAVVDVCVPPHKWVLRQTQTGYNEELAQLSDLMLLLWDSFLSLADTKAVFFVSSGLPSYSVCNLLDRRVIQDKAQGIVVLSPTLYLPVSSLEKSEWYSKNSLVMVPTKREKGVAIPTNESFGCCYSFGGEDPKEISMLIAESRHRVFDFIRNRTPPPSTPTP